METRRASRGAVICALFAALVTVAAQVASRRPSFHPSLLLNVAEDQPMAAHVAALDSSFQLSATTDHYDGVYFLAMALDPFARGEAHDLIDLAAYRYGHPFYSWLAALLSGGQPGLLAWVFWGLSIASMAGAAAGVALLAHRLGASPWWGLLVAVSPGLLFSATTALTEPFQVALVSVLLLLWLRPRTHPLLLGVVVVAMCLTKEQLVLVPFALGLSLLGQMWRERHVDLERLGALVAGPVALGAWLWYVRGQFTAEQKQYDAGNLHVPGQGWLEVFDLAGHLRVGEFHAAQIGSTAVPGLVALAALMVVAAVIGLRRRDELGLVVVLQAVLISALGWRTLLYPHEMFRIPSLAVVFACLLIAVELSGRRARP